MSDFMHNGIYTWKVITDYITETFRGTYDYAVDYILKHFTNPKEIYCNETLLSRVKDIPFYGKE